MSGVWKRKFSPSLSGRNRYAPLRSLPGLAEYLSITTWHLFSADQNYKDNTMPVQCMQLKVIIVIIENIQAFCSKQIKKTKLGKKTSTVGDPKITEIALWEWSFWSMHSSGNELWGQLSSVCSVCSFSKVTFGCSTLFCKSSLVLLVFM